MIIIQTKTQNFEILRTISDRTIFLRIISTRTHIFLINICLSNNPLNRKLRTHYFNLFLRPINDELIQLKGNPDYFGIFDPVSGAVIAQNQKLLNFLLKEGFLVTRQSFYESLQNFNTEIFNILLQHSIISLDAFLPWLSTNNEKFILDILSRNLIDFQINFQKTH